jgi:hypothetical protein
VKVWAREPTEATHDVAQRLIASWLDPTHEPRTVLDLSRLPAAGRTVEATGPAEPAYPVQQGVQTKDEIEC